MSKVKTDALESYTTNGVLTMMSDVVLASGKGITVPGATDLDGGLTVDGSGDSATVATGDVFVGTGTLKVGGATSSPNATINTNGAAAFQSLTVNGLPITGNSGGTAAGVAIVASGLITLSSTNSPVASNLVGCNVAQIIGTAGFSSQCTFNLSSTPSQSNIVTIAWPNHPGTFQGTAGVGEVVITATGVQGSSAQPVVGTLHGTSVTPNGTLAVNFVVVAF